MMNFQDGKLERTKCVVASRAVVTVCASALSTVTQALRLSLALPLALAVTVSMAPRAGGPSRPAGNLNCRGPGDRDASSST